MAILPAQLELPVDHISIARLHGLACFHCGATVGPLVDAGWVETRTTDGVLPWNVVACEDDCTSTGRSR